jgi:hypothetical protein
MDRCSYHVRQNAEVITYGHLTYDKGSNALQCIENGLLITGA